MQEQIESTLLWLWGLSWKEWGWESKAGFTCHLQLCRTPAKAAWWAEVSESPCPHSAILPLSVSGFWNCHGFRILCETSRSTCDVLNFVPFWANKLWTQPSSLPILLDLVYTSDMSLVQFFHTALKLSRTRILFLCFLVLSESDHHSVRADANTSHLPSWECSSSWDKLQPVRTHCCFRERGVLTSE